MTQRITPRYMHITGAAIIALEQGSTDIPVNVEAVENKLTTVNYVWNAGTLSYDVMVQPSTGGASGAGSTAVDATLTSGGSTRIVGTVNQGSPGGSSADAWWVRTVSTGSAGAGSTSVDASLTSLGSTKLVGQVTVANPTTSVSLSSQATVTVGNPTTSVSLSSQITASVTGTTSVNIANSPTVVQGAGSTSVAPWYVISSAGGAGSTTVDANLSSAGSTRQVGLVGLLAGSSGNTVGAVALVAGTSANTLGSVALVAGTTANSIGSVALVAGTSANLVGGVVINSGTTAITLGAAALLAGGSSIGSVQQGLGSSANFWTMDGFAFTSAITSRTSISTTVDASVVAANANQKSLVIANLSTVQTVALGLSTGAVTTALANASVFLPPASQLCFGGVNGDFPNYTGAIRGINITSTTVGGGVAVTRFINT